MPTQRQSPGTVTPGGEVTVTVTTADYRTFGAVTETPPAGFDYSSSSPTQGRSRPPARRSGSSGKMTVPSGIPSPPPVRRGKIRSAGYRPIPTGPIILSVGASRVTVQRASGPGPTNNPPTFSGDQATRSVPESTGAGMNIGARVQRTDRDGDTPTYPQGGTDAASFALRHCRTDRPVSRPKMRWTRKPSPTTP